ncbi:LytR C-terminal domain-containing protein [Arthrobacter sp. CAL618]|uniref:LytR C-terminal domain-containing protein n=1 Tax=Arthrobacter sp. CAL618 TaxID=1055770 RepID=UPI0003FACE85|nr:LytR C-terminal domain-containing protein [Arthrobacter sp. CAL618]
MSQYPRDEFDKIPESASRQGVHRERLVPPRSSGLALKILVGVLALAVGLAAYFILPRLGIGQTESSASQTTTAPVAETTSNASPAPADDDASEPEPTPSNPATQAPTGAPTDEPTEAEPTPSEEPAAIDRAQAVNVYNSTGIGGLASSAAGRVTAGGWTVGQIADWGGAPPQTSVIFYNNASQLAAAQEVAGILGIPTLVETTEVSSSITVVVGPGFQ